MPPPRTEKPQQTPFRAPPALMRLLRECAARHGRSVAEELRLAVELHVTRALVEQLPKPEVQKELGGEAARIEEDMRAKLARLLETTYRPGKPQGLLDSLILVNRKVPK
ncbi:MAG: hypothetical protein ACRDNE_04930 [Gaiellaceae bacterium]